MAECSVCVLPSPAMALVIARRGRSEFAAAAAAEAFGAALPETPRIVSGSDMEFAWCGPERWLVLAPEHLAAPAGGIEALLAPVFASTASVTEQTGSRVLLRVSGPGARATLAKGLPIDLHPRVFATGHTALCRANHVALQIWQTDESPRYVLALPRSHAAGWQRWLLEAAAATASREA